MKYTVTIASQAKIEFWEAAQWWAENRSVEQAIRWVDQFQAAIDGLSENPERHAYAREDASLPKTTRQLLFGLGRRPSHRALFYIEGNSVNVICIRHVAQQGIDE